MPPISYRIIRATPADIPTIHRIAHRVWPVAFRDILPPAQIDYMLDMMYRPDALQQQMAEGHVFHLLLDDEGPAGGSDYAGAGRRYRAVGYVSHQLEYLRDTTKLHKLYVLPELQGRGYGKALIRKVEQVARRAGQKALRLDVNYQNPALHFYESLGFEKLERADKEIGRGYLMEDWILVKIFA